MLKGSVGQEFGKHAAEMASDIIWKSWKARADTLSDLVVSVWVVTGTILQVPCLSPIALCKGEYITTPTLCLKVEQSPESPRVRAGEDARREAKWFSFLSQTSFSERNWVLSFHLQLFSLLLPRILRDKLKVSGSCLIKKLKKLAFFYSSGSQAGANFTLPG